MAEEAVLSLKPCPFCGEIEKLEYDGDGGFIVCRGCGTFGPDPSNGIPLFDSDDTDEAEAKVNAAVLWNKRAHVPTPDATIHCEFPSCPNEADYEGWYRRRDPFLGTPMGHIVRIAFCEEHKSHPHLCANESKSAAKDQG